MSKFKLVSDPSGAIDIASNVLDFFKIGSFVSREYNTIFNPDAIKKLNLKKDTEIELLFFAGESTFTKNAGTIGKPKNFRGLDLSMLEDRSIRVLARFFPKGKHRVIGTTQPISAKEKEGPIGSFIKLEARSLGDTTSWAMGLPEDDFPIIYLNQDKIDLFDTKLRRNPILFSLIIPSALIQSLIHFTDQQDGNYEWIKAFQEIIEAIDDDDIPNYDESHDNKLVWANKVASKMLASQHVIKKLNAGISKYEENGG